MSCFDFWIMNEIRGIDAIELAKEISKLPDGRFTVAFFQFNAKKGEASTQLRIIEDCKVRTQLPEDRFFRDSDNYFLFEDKDGNPKTCYRVLLRFIGFSSNNNELRKVNWM